MHWMTPTRRFHAHIDGQIPWGGRATRHADTVGSKAMRERRKSNKNGDCSSFSLGTSWRYCTDMTRVMRIITQRWRAWEQGRGIFAERKVPEQWTGPRSTAVVPWRWQALRPGSLSEWGAFVKMRKGGGRDGTLQEQVTSIPPPPPSMMRIPGIVPIFPAAFLTWAGASGSRAVLAIKVRSPLQIKSFFSENPEVYPCTITNCFRRSL